MTLYPVISAARRVDPDPAIPRRSRAGEVFSGGALDSFCEAPNMRLPSTAGFRSRRARRAEAVDSPLLLRLPRECVAGPMSSGSKRLHREPGDHHSPEWQRQSPSGRRRARRRPGTTKKVLDRIEDSSRVPPPAARRGAESVRHPNGKPSSPRAARHRCLRLPAGGDEKKKLTRAKIRVEYSPPPRRKSKWNAADESKRSPKSAA